jgi:hypothetical protein
MHVVQADICQLPLKRSFVGVGLWRGEQSLIISLVNPVRERFTSRISPWALHLSRLPTAAVYVASKFAFRPLSKGPLGDALARKLFYSDYLISIARFGWRKQHTIVFDHLVAPTAHYMKREEFEDWCAGLASNRQ